MIESGGGSLLFFVIVGGALGEKGKNRSFIFWCVISCDNRILMKLLLESGKLVYSINII